MSPKRVKVIALVGNLSSAASGLIRRDVLPNGDCGVKFTTCCQRIPLALNRLESATMASSLRFAMAAITYVAPLRYCARAINSFSTLRNDCQRSPDSIHSLDSNRCFRVSPLYGPRIDCRGCVRSTQRRAHPAPPKYEQCSRSESADCAGLPSAF